MNTTQGPILAASTGTRKQVRRQTILSAAKKVFAQQGYHSASISDIVVEAKIARGTFYSYFDSKHAILDTILNEALSELTSLIRGVEVGKGAPSPKQQIRDNLSRVFTFLLQDVDLAAVLLVRVPTAEPELTKRINVFNNSVIALVQTGIEIGMKLGIVRECAPRLVSAATVGAVRGALEELMRMESVAIDPMVDETVNLVLSGVASHVSA